MNRLPSVTPRRSRPRRFAFVTFAAALGLVASVGLFGSSVAATAVAPAAALQALPALDLSSYTGTWYQVAWFPNRFQKQCVSDTTATYARRDDGAVDVLNRCRLADGSFDDVRGLARPAGATLVGDTLQPAQLQVSFLPAWLRWLPIWGDYWVIQRPDHGRYAVISEASRQYLWVLARTPALSADDLQAIRSRLLEQGFDLTSWTLHAHTAAAPATGAGRSQRPPTPPAGQTR